MKELKQNIREFIILNFEGESTSLDLKFELYQKRMGIVKYDKFGYIVTLKEEAQLSDYRIHEGEYLFITRDPYK